MQWCSDADLCVGGRISSCPSGYEDILTEDNQREDASFQEEMDILLKDVLFDLSTLVL